MSSLRIQSSLARRTARLDASSLRSRAEPRASTARTAARFGLLILLVLAACSGAGAEGPIANRVEMSVTEKGFEPQNLRVKKGEPVTLIITRKTDTTCATEIVIDEHGIKTPLPLNTKVTVSFTPKKSGQLKYGCAMQKMIGGVITVL